MSRRAGQALLAAMMAVAIPSIARADLGPNFPTPCDDKHEGEPCKTGGAEGKCIRRGSGMKRYLVCAPPLEPSAYPPVAEPWASTTAAPTPLPSASASPAPAPSGGCSCAVDADLGGLASVPVCAALAVGASLALRRKRTR